jgi:pyruvate/2-oxoglutarate dehydrogenase complex dihydrolipoamide acyltransferase (E2) component
VSWSPSDGSSVAEDAPAPETDGVELTVPGLAGSADAARIVAWDKRVGDAVAADEPICRLVVDGMQFEVHSTAAGELRRVFALAGATVRSGDSLAEIVVPGPRREPPAEGEDPPFYVTEPPAADHELTPIEDRDALDVGGLDDWPPSGDVDWSRWHSPVVRMLAERHGIELSDVRGTGIDGRIRKRDLLAHVSDSEHD